MCRLPCRVSPLYQFTSSWWRKANVILSKWWEWWWWLWNWWRRKEDHPICVVALFSVTSALRLVLLLNTSPTNRCASVASLRSMCRCIMFFFKGWIPWSWQAHGQLRPDIQTQFSLRKLRRARRDQSACSPARCFGQKWTRCCANINIIGWEVFFKVEEALVRFNQHLLFTLYVRCSLLLSE